MILIVDDGWAAAQNWAGRQAAVTNLIDQAEREGRAVVVATTAPAAADQASRRAPSMMTPTEARGVVESLQPKPWSTDREFALGPLIGFGGLTVDKPGHVVWLSDGLGGEAAADMAGKLKRLGAVTVVADAPEALARVLRPPVSEGGALVLRAVRADAGSENSGWVRALAEDGRPLAREALRFARGALDAEVSVRIADGTAQPANSARDGGPGDGGGRRPGRRALAPPAGWSCVRPGYGGRAAAPVGRSLLPGTGVGPLYRGAAGVCRRAFAKAAGGDDSGRSGTPGRPASGRDWKAGLPRVALRFASPVRALPRRPMV